MGHKTCHETSFCRRSVLTITGDRGHTRLEGSQRMQRKTTSAVDVASRKRLSVYSRQTIVSDSHWPKSRCAFLVVRLDSQGHDVMWKKDFTPGDGVIPKKSVSLVLVTSDSTIPRRTVTSLSAVYDRCRADSVGRAVSCRLFSEPENKDRSVVTLCNADMTVSPCDGCTRLSVSLSSELRNCDQVLVNSGQTK